MSKKIKGVCLGSTTPYGVRLYEDSRARMQYQTLMQEYHELLKEVDMMRSRLDAEKQRKMILTAEVRFLRRRYRYFMKTNTVNSSQKQKLVQLPNLQKPTKRSKEFRRGEANVNMLPSIPEFRPKKKKYISKAALHGASPVSQHPGKMLEGSTMTRNLSHIGRVHARNLMANTAPVLDSNKEEGMQANDTTPRNTSVSFDLNRGDSSSTGKELRVPSPTHIFDLNVTTTGDEDFQTNAEAEKFDGSSMRHPNDEAHNDLMLTICSGNAGEGPSRVEKRKISWQDPVPVRV